MVSITKEEKMEILKRYPRTHIVRTVKGKSKRHHYYCSETREALSVLKEIRDKKNNM